jgi:hypothetical protein
MAMVIVAAAAVVVALAEVVVQLVTAVDEAVVLDEAPGEDVEVGAAVEPVGVADGVVWPMLDPRARP